MLTFDIETGPLPDDQLRQIYDQPEPPPPPGPFDESAVKLGNLKDEAKIKAKIHEASKAHEQAIREHATAVKTAAENHWKRFREQAALDATTGQVIAIGYFNPDTDQCVIDHGDEAALVDRFWRKAQQLRSERRQLVGLNIHDFDLPFLIRRSWILGVMVPTWTIAKDRYFDSVFLDLRKTWLCGQYGTGTKSSFAHLGKAFGTGGKPEGVDGGQFAELWESDRDKAVAYLENDLRQPAAWAARMGIL